LREVEPAIAVRVPLRHDGERRRWYSDGGEDCLVLTARGRLLEPHPTFGPQAYQLLAQRVSFREAGAYARAHGFPHLRTIEPRPEAAP
jgi:hypothetical protein